METIDKIREFIDCECEHTCLSQDLYLKDYLLVCLELYNENEGQWYQSFKQRKED